MRKYFGTDGIRGVAGDTLTSSLALKFGKSLVKFMNNNKIKIAIGSDSRISKDMLFASIAAGITSMGADVIYLGVVTTPALSYITKDLECDFGVMISASHNPANNNGIKVFNSEGHKLTDFDEEKIEEFMDMDFKESLIQGSITFNYDAIESYITFVKESLKAHGFNQKVLIDCSNGAASEIAPKIFDFCDFINFQPNGLNINDKCGSTHMDLLRESVVNNKYDLGIAFDGDADRCLFVSSDGSIIDGDYTLAIVGKYLKDNNKLNSNTIVGTVMSNIGLKNFCFDNDINFVETQVGDRYIILEMEEKSYNLGGEQSGHTILKDYEQHGDGIFTAVMMINILNDYKSSIGDLAKIMKKYPQVLVNAKVKIDKKNEVLNNKNVENIIEKYNKVLGNNGRILVRPSGTEPIVRVMIEGEDVNSIATMANDIKDVIEKEIN